MMYLFKEEIFMYLFLLCIYLFIYTIIIMVTATVNSVEVLKKKGREADIIKRNERQHRRKKGLRWQRTLHNAGAEVTPRSYNISFWKIFVFIFYDRFCKITNLREIYKKQKGK